MERDKKYSNSMRISLLNKQDNDTTKLRSRYTKNDNYNILINIDDDHNNSFELKSYVVGLLSRSEGFMILDL